MALTLAWSALATGSIWYGLSISYAQPVSLLAGTAFSLGLHTAARQISRFQEAQRRAAEAEALDAERSIRRLHELERLRSTIEPTLRGLAEGTLGEADRREVGFLEASLRDGLRGRVLNSKQVASRVLDARRRGADVLLLDDTHGRQPDDESIRAASEWIVTQLSSIDGGDVTVRLVWEGDLLVATVASDTTDARLSIPLNAHR